MPWLKKLRHLTFFISLFVRLVRNMTKIVPIFNVKYIV